MLMNHLRSKIIFLSLVLVFTAIFNFGIVNQVSAQEVEAAPIEQVGPPSFLQYGTYNPITPGGTRFFEGAGFETMVQKIFTLTIYFTVILSVLMIIYGGVEYMGSESVFTKGKGRERIQAALLGLFIALVSILLISTLVPGYQGNAFEVNIFGE